MGWTPEKQKIGILEVHRTVRNLLCPGPIWAWVWLYNLLPGILAMLSGCGENVSSSIAS